MSSVLGARRIVGVGLKMYLDHPRTLEWIREVREIALVHPAILSGDVALFVLPTFPALVEAREILSDTSVFFGAQDLAWADAGPYTGEVSGIQLRQIGCSLVEVGHAERRTHFGEDDNIVARKLEAAQRNGLVPVLCVGEYERTSSSQAGAFCVEQLESTVATCLESGMGGPMIVAYEPVWAIGAPAPAPIDYIREVIGHLRHALDVYPQLAGSRLIYGGSAGAGLLPSLTPAVDGLFLGRSTHDTTVLKTILDEAAAS